MCPLTLERAYNSGSELENISTPEMCILLWNFMRAVARARKVKPKQLWASVGCI